MHHIMSSSEIRKGPDGLTNTSFVLKLFWRDMYYIISKLSLLEYLYVVSGSKIIVPYLSARIERENLNSSTEHN